VYGPTATAACGRGSDLRMATLGYRCLAETLPNLSLSCRAPRQIHKQPRVAPTVQSGVEILNLRRSYIREIEEEAALFALDALPSEEAGNFRQRLDTGCSLCRGLLQEYRNTVAVLPLAAPEAEPSPGLRQRLMERVGVREKGRRASAGSIVRAGDTPWEQSPMPGIEIRQLYGRKTMLVRMAPGTVYPEHEHTLASSAWYWKAVSAPAT